MNPDFDASLYDEEKNQDVLSLLLSLCPMIQKLLISLGVIAASYLVHKCMHDPNRSNGKPSPTSNSNASDKNNVHSTPVVPFLFMEEPRWRDLHVMLEKYRSDSDNLLHGVSQSLEVALFSEREMGVSTSSSRYLLSTRLQRHLDQVSAALEHNEKELNQMMQAFPVRYALPSSSQEEAPQEDVVVAATTEDNKNGTKGSGTSNLFTLHNRFHGMGSDSKNAYDCGAQVIAHIVRDWTVLGQGVRNTVYDWCRAMVEKHATTTALPILVPGAGLGRLAHDLAFLSGFSVEANEISLSMAAGAHSILDNNPRNGTIYPFALDFFANEVEAERRYDEVAYPNLPNTIKMGSLSYTVGDFVKIYRWQRPRGSFQCVVTCFFIDTATNVYEYLSTIEHALESGGVWVNIGPLRWHHNSILHPAADELRSMVESSVFAFDVVHWSVDDQPSSYRQDDNEFWIGNRAGDGFVRSTSYEGYRPLRFVVKRR